MCDHEKTTKKGVKNNYYGRLIDFLSQILKMSCLNLLDLADFLMHHQIPVSFLMWQPWLCTHTAACLCLQYVHHFRLCH